MENTLRLTERPRFYQESAECLLGIKFPEESVFVILHGVDFIG